MVVNSKYYLLHCVSLLSEEVNVFNSCQIALSSSRGSFNNYVDRRFDSDDMKLILDQGSYSYSFNINLQKHTFNKQDTDTNRSNMNGPSKLAAQFLALNSVFNKQNVLFLPKSIKFKQIY